MNNKKASSVHITGLVQGVGFRPFIYRLAQQNHICGWVENGSDGVRIHAEGLGKNLQKFIEKIAKEAPPASQILEISTVETDWLNEKSFQIKKSTDNTDDVTEISPDIALCPECLADLKIQTHRINYPFINCTNCGPRFSIIKNLPYDRATTTMHPFEMCPVCSVEYSDVLDRRFHAQPVACNHCGPHYELIVGKESYSGIENIIEKTAGLLTDGKIIAIKGMGGFHLACDATNENAVGLLRQRKIREGKPFAVMFRNLKEISNFMEIKAVEETELISWRKPIVILNNKKSHYQLAPDVSNGFDSTGVMLPYMPIHYLLFEKLDIPAIVLTSGNLSDEPVMIDNEEAQEHLGRVADGFLVYNRDIYNRTDDSVLMFTGNQQRLIRRSRGYAPAPVNLHLNTDGIFAAGAELVNCFCVGKGNKAIMSQHIGDLKNIETLDFYTESLARYMDMFRVKPELLVCDLHPDYLSSRYAEELSDAKGGIPLLRIQHHHAHIASCMAEHHLDEKVIGISLDGVGYGTDGNIWGFEAMICDLLDFERMAHLEYVKQPGGDKANKEPWRMALSYLYSYASLNPGQIDFPSLRNIDPEKTKFIISALENNINTPITSSAGRLFDAVSALTGICTYSSFHAEAPMRLENCIDPKETGFYDFELGTTINPELIIKGILQDLDNNIPIPVISAKFHKTVVNIILELALKLNKETGIIKVVLSGGTFQNRYILSECERLLHNNNFKVYTQRLFPSNDGGIALGQLVIAAKRREAGIL